MYQEVGKYFLVRDEAGSNGHLYISYRSSSQKNKAEECKKLTARLHPFARLLQNLLYLVPLWLRKPNMKVPILFTFFLSYSSSSFFLLHPA